MRFRSVVLVLGLVLAACASDDDSAANQAPDTVPATDAGAGEPADSTAAEDSAVAATTDTAADEATDTAESAAAAFELSVSATLAERNGLGAEVVVTASEPAYITLEAASADHTVTSPATADAAIEHTLPMVGMRAERDYTLTAVAHDGDGAELGRAETTLTTGALPALLPSYEFEADISRTSPGVTMVEFAELGFTTGVGPGTQFAADDAGEVVWYYEPASSFTIIKETGQGTFLGLLDPGVMIEFDTLGRTIAQWALPSIEDTSPADPNVPLTMLDADLAIYGPHHDFSLLPNGNLLVMTTIWHDVDAALRTELCPDDDNEWLAISDVIVEFTRDGDVVRTWDLWDMYPIAEWPGSQLCLLDTLFATETLRDWTHGNAAVYDPDRDVVLVSIRHLDLVAALEHPDTEGAVTDVAFTLGPRGTMAIDGGAQYHQHAPEVQGDGSILLYDNGNGRLADDGSGPVDPPYSRAVLYAIDDAASDPADWTATQTWEYVAERDGAPIFTPFVGDANRLENGNVLIDFGGVSDGESLSAVLIQEVAPAADSGGDVVLELSFGGTEDDVYASYRATRMPTLFIDPVWEAAPDGSS